MRFAPMKLTDFKVLSFDCYGTLVDWESGIWNALAPLLTAGANVDRETALQTFGALEAEQEHETPNLLYRHILARVHAKLARAWNVAPDAKMDDHEIWRGRLGAQGSRSGQGPNTLAEVTAQHALQYIR